MAPGGTASFQVRSLDANGMVVSEIVDSNMLKWASYIPAAARALRMTTESRSSIPRFKRPTAFLGLSDRKEFEQTSSAQRSVW